MARTTAPPAFYYQGDTPMVAIVRYVSECDVQPLRGLNPMPYDQAVAVLAELDRTAPAQLAGLDLCYTGEAGELGRFASWSLPARTRCPDIPEHRCLDCAPPARGRPRFTDGLSDGSPLGPVTRDPARASDPAAFAEHFERVEVARGDNRDGVVRVAQPDQPRQAKAKAARPKPARTRAAIPVILPR